MEDRRRLLKANVPAARFFRVELLRATSSWPMEYVKALGADSVLAADSAWQVGFAPPSRRELVEHLRVDGFSYGTLVRAGLVNWSDAGEAIDQHQDRLMLMARDHRLSPVGFIGVGRDGQARSVSPVSGFDGQSGGHGAWGDSWGRGRGGGGHWRRTRCHRVVAS
ncbi:hypothetical protein AB0I34_30540 [Kribbella sp. NPDC050281]|uniref:hypothetical protein n=1 Tax=Kribbella sp. NPDC050281 TaxID=3155515 RepID=UPI0033FFFF0C